MKTLTSTGGDSLTIGVKPKASASSGLETEFLAEIGKRLVCFELLLEGVCLK